MTDRISREEARRVAHLARIALTEEEAGRFQTELERILEYVEQLADVDVDGVQPLSQPVPLALPLRVAPARDTLSRDELMASAPDAVDGFFRVPPAIDP